VKALLCKAHGPPETLVLEDVPAPKPGRGEALIAVRAAGVNFPDVLIIENKYQFKPPLPFSPGAEVSGVVESVGEGVSDLRPGMRVLASIGWGGFAESVVARGPRVFPIPDAMDFETAAALLLTYGTSHHALKDRAKLKAGESLVVLGASGGVGVAAIELARAAGARVIAAASSDEKLAFAKDCGAHETLKYPAGRLTRDDQKALADEIKRLTGGEGADVVYDPVGGDYAEPALRAIAWEGRYLVVGFAAGEIPKIPLNLALLKGCDILGVFWGAFTEREPEKNRENVRELMSLFTGGKIRPRVSKVYPLARAAEALADLSARRAMGKLVIQVPGDA
jgi:NADPH2:quinone reductase